MRDLPVVYRRPRTLRYKQPSPFAAVIASRDLQAAQERVARYEGEEVIKQVPLADRVQMRLQGAPSEVDIVANGDPTRVVSDIANVTWTWTVTPKVPEDIELELVVYNVARVGKEDVLIDGPVYSDRFTVDTPPIDRLIHWITHTDPIWKWIGTIMGVIGGGGLIGWWNMRRKPKPSKADPSPST